MLTIDLKTITLVNYFDQPRKDPRENHFRCEVCGYPLAYKIVGQRNNIEKFGMFICDFNQFECGSDIYKKHVTVNLKLIEDFRNAGWNIVNIKL